MVNILYLGRWWLYFLGLLTPLVVLMVTEVFFWDLGRDSASVPMCANMSMYFLGSSTGIVLDGRCAFSFVDVVVVVVVHLGSWILDRFFF